MKITKQQLRRIIREAKFDFKDPIKSARRRTDDARRLEGLHANVADVEAVRQAVTKLYDNVARDIEAEPVDEMEAERMVHAVVTIVLADALDSLGMSSQYHALTMNEPW